MTQRLRVAAATDDGQLFVDRHFGDAEFYEVFEMSCDGFTCVCRIENRTKDGEVHADPRKARGIAGILAEKGVQVAVGKAFGPNIKRIRKRFVCVLLDHEEIRSALEEIMSRFSEIVTELERGERRAHLDWRDRRLSQKNR